MKKILLAILIIFGLSVAIGVVLEFFNEEGAGAGHKHRFSEDWSYDASEHWHAAVCEHTEERADVAEHGFDLSLDDVYGESLHGIHAERVLCRDGGDGRGGKAAVGRDALDVGLYAGSASRVAAGDGENAGVILNFEF